MTLPDTPEIRLLLSQLGYDSHFQESDRPDAVAGYEESLLQSTGILNPPDSPL